MSLEHARCSVPTRTQAPPSASADSLSHTGSPRSQWLQVLALICGGLSLCLVLESRAFAEASEYRMAVFALESDDLQDQFAVRLAQQLRVALDARSDYALQDTRVSLTQLSLAQNCNTAEPKCLAAIAQSLGVDGFVFGKVTHEGGAPVALLRRYDLWGQQVDRSAMVSFTSTDPRRTEIERASTKALTDLLGPVPVATPVTNELAAPVAPKLQKPGRLTPPDNDVLGSRIAGYALLGGAVLSAGASVLSFVEVRRSERNREFERYRLAVGSRNNNVSDVCDEANAGRAYGMDAASFREVKSACSRGKAFEILQFVFIGSAVVSGGLAAYFLTSGGGPREQAKATRMGGDTWSLHPTIARKGFGLGARVQF